MLIEINYIIFKINNKEDLLIDLKHSFWSDINIGLMYIVYPLLRTSNTSYKSFV